MYRVALIGAGRVGYKFDFGTGLPENHAAAVAAHPRFELVAGVDRDAEKLADFGRRCGVDALHEDLDAMLGDVGPDVCIAAVPPEWHPDVVERCAAAPSVRAVICEKPMALSLAECDRMIAACEAGGAVLQINHNRRWHPEWLLAGRLVADGAIGELMHIQAHIDGAKPAPWWVSEHEGPLLHDFTHWLDMLDLYAGPVAWVMGFVEQRRRPYAVEDFAAAVVKFESGVTATIHSAELTDYGDAGFDLRGTIGLVRLRGDRAELWQAALARHEPDSGFTWHQLQPVEIDHPEPASTYVCGLDDVAVALGVAPEKVETGKGDVPSC